MLAQIQQQLAALQQDNHLLTQRLTAQDVRASQAEAEILTMQAAAAAGIPGAPVRDRLQEALIKNVQGLNLLMMIVPNGKNGKAYFARTWGTSTETCSGRWSTLKGAKTTVQTVSSMHPCHQAHVTSTCGSHNI